MYDLHVVSEEKHLPKYVIDVLLCLRHLIYRNKKN